MHRAYIVVNKRGYLLWSTGDSRWSNEVDNTGNNQRAVAEKSRKLAKFRVWDKIPEGGTLILWDTRTPFQHSVGEAKGSLCVKKHLDP